MPQMFNESREREREREYFSLNQDNQDMIDNLIHIVSLAQKNSSPDWQPNTSLLAYEEAKRRASQPRDKTREEYGLDELADEIFGKQE